MRTFTDIFSPIRSLFGKRQTAETKENSAFKDAEEGLIADINSGKHIIKTEKITENGDRFAKITFSQGPTRLINRSLVSLKISKHLFYYDIALSHEDKNTIYRFAKETVAPQSVKILTASTDNNDFWNIHINISPSDALTDCIDRTNVYLNFSDKFKEANPQHSDLMLPSEQSQRIEGEQNEYLLKISMCKIPYFRYWSNKDNKVESDIAIVADMFDIVLAYPRQLSKINTITDQANAEFSCEYAYANSVNSAGFISNILTIVADSANADYIYSNAKLCGSVEIDTELFPCYAEYIRSMEAHCVSIEHYDYDDTRKTNIDNTELMSMISFVSDNVSGPAANIRWSLTPNETAIREHSYFNIGDYLKINIKACAIDKTGTRFDDDKTICIRHIDTAITGILKEWKSYLPTETITTLLNENFSTSGSVRDSLLKAWGFPASAKIAIMATPAYRTFALDTPQTFIFNNPMVAVDINEANNEFKVDLDNKIAVDQMQQGLLLALTVDGIAVEARLTYDIKLPVVTAKYAPPIAGYNTPTSSINMQTYAIHYVSAPSDTAVEVSKLLDTTYIELSADAEMPEATITSYTYTDSTDPDLIGDNLCGYVSKTKAWANTSTSIVLHAIDNVYVKLSSGQLLPITNIRKDNGILLTNNAGKIHIDTRPDMLSSIMTDPVNGGIGKMYVFGKLEDGVAIDDILVSAIFVSSTTPTLGYSNVCRNNRIAKIEFVPSGISVAAIASDELKASLDEIKALGINDLVYFHTDCKNVCMHSVKNINIPSWRGNIIQSVEIIVTDNWGHKQTSTVKLLLFNRPE